MIKKILLIEIVCATILTACSSNESLTINYVIDGVEYSVEKPVWSECRDLRYHYVPIYCIRYDNPNIYRLIYTKRWQKTEFDEVITESSQPIIIKSVYRNDKYGSIKVKTKFNYINY